MKENPVIDRAARRAQYSRQTESAEQLEREGGVRNADLQSRGFLVNVIIPLLRDAENRLSGMGVAAITTVRLTPGTARCLFTVTRDEDQPPAILAFEAWPGSTSPRIRWTNSSGGGPQRLADMDRNAVERIIGDFLDHVICR